MLSIAELTDQQDTEAIAEIIRQELQPLEIDHLAVEVNIIDSSLELQIRTNSAVDREKLLTLVCRKFQDLRIELVTKFRVHCWRNDEQMHEQRLLWVEQFMLEPLELSLIQSPELESDKVVSPDMRSPEPQLSKHSVLQQAINKISPTNHKAQIDLLAAELAEQTLTNSNKTTNPSIMLSHVEEPASSSYWQLLLVGLSIVLLGLGIGASVRAITIKSVTEKVPAVSAASSEADILVKSATTKNVTKSIASQSNETSVTTAKDLTAKSLVKSDRSSEMAATSNNPDINNIPESPITVSSSGLPEGETVVTLEKFNRIQKGMTIEQVEKILGSSGKVIAENNSSDSIGKVYSWKNTQGSNAIIEFKDGQVVAKAQAGL